MRIELRKQESPTAHLLYLGDVTLAFSYETVVAFAFPGYGWVACENIWSRTTGKHMKQMIPGGVERLPYDVFERLLETLLSHGTLDVPAAIEALHRVDGRLPASPAPTDVATWLEAS